MSPRIQKGVTFVMLPLQPRRLAPLLLLALVLCLQPAARAQVKEQPAGQQVFCDPSRAVVIVKMQLSEAKAFADPVKRISVMTRAADLLWPYEGDSARAVFSDAYDLASAYFRERGDEVRHERGRADDKSPGLVIQLPDQRFVVLRAIARHDVAWARELAARAAEETRAQAEKDSSAVEDGQRRPVGEKLLSFAEELLPTDRQAALAVARSTLGDPAGMFLPRFLYEVAKVDRAAADALFADALAAYSERDIDSLLYLSAYPFAATDPIVHDLDWMYAAPPKGFAASPELQRQFVAAFLRLSERRLAALTEQPPAEGPSWRHTEPEQIYTGLRALEALYGARQPDALERIAALKTQALVLLPAERQRSVAPSTPPDAAPDPGGGNWFDNAIERAERQADPDKRDSGVAFAILQARPPVELEKGEAAAQKIGDTELRGQVLNSLYFDRAQRAAKAGALDDARKLAERVGALDERALLFLDIADRGLKQAGDSVRAAELLGAVVAAAQKAPETDAKARALLGVAHLYTKFDQLRALEVMGEAVKTINRLREPDLSAAFLLRKIQGKSFGMFMSHEMPGFSLENSFRELGGRDFEAALSAANNLDDKYLRATAVLAVAARCLEESQKLQPRKPAAKPTPAAKKPETPKPRP
jgi:hypothetical protein